MIGCALRRAVYNCGINGSFITGQSTYQHFNNIIFRKMSDGSVALNCGNKMPQLGLGCWLTSAQEIEASVSSALESGYKHIDTAAAYVNEEGVGTAIHKYLKKYNKNRDELYVVTKLPMNGNKAEKVELHLRNSLKKLQLDYVDQYLIHFPAGLKGKNDDDYIPFDENMRICMDFSTDLIAIWKEMERMVKLGLTKSIGVSNFNTRQLTKICAIANILPAVNQVEMHVYMQQKELQKLCKEHNMYITAYSPLGSPGRTAFIGEPSGSANRSPPMDDPVVNLIAKNHNVTSAQVLLRFLVQQNVIAIPKSTNPTRIKTNNDIWGFKLSDLEMAALYSLDKGEAGRILNLTEALQMRSHPECPY